MPLGYRKGDKAFENLVQKLAESTATNIEFGRNRYALVENKEAKEYKNILSPESAEKLLKDLKVDFDGCEDYGGGRVYTLKNDIVAEYLPQFMNITVYQNLEDTLLKPAMPVPTPKDANIVDTNNRPAKESKLKEDYSSFTPTSAAPATGTTSMQQKKYVPDARGITNKQVADTLAQQQNGVVANDDQDKGKFMVVQAENVVDDANKVQGAKDVGEDVVSRAAANTMPSAVNLKIPESQQSLEDTKKKIEELKAKIPTLKGKEKSDAEKNLKGEESYIRYLQSQGAKESKTNEGPNGGSPFQQEGHWSDSLTEDCIIKPGEVYKFSDGEEIHIDRVEGTTIVFNAGGREESMQYEEFDHLLHSGELKRMSESKNELAEKLFLVRELIQRKPGTLTEKQKKFIKETLAIKLDEETRSEVEKIVIQRFGDLMK